MLYFLRHFPFPMPFSFFQFPISSGAGDTLEAQTASFLEYLRQAFDLFPCPFHLLYHFPVPITWHACAYGFCMLWHLHWRAEHTMHIVNDGKHFVRAADSYLLWNE
jgi:hypothetical protein